MGDTMNWKTGIKLLCIALILFTTGCATGLTLVAPRVEEVSHGKKEAGDRINVIYTLTENDGTYALTRQPLCKEQVEEIRTTRKRPRGFILALAETAFYGAGIVDYVVAKIYANLSDEEIARAMVDSGEVIPCGDPEKAAGEEVILQFPDSERIQHLLTDDNARIPLEALLAKEMRDLQINVFVKREGNILYIKTIDQTFTF